MKILILGGTRFVGRHLVQAALSRGHGLTLFNRGVSNPGIFPNVESIHGDRAKDLDRLAGRRWDAVIDTSAYFPGVVKTSTAALKDAVDRYVFISTISVYADYAQKGIDEDYPLANMDEALAEVPNMATYGARKVLCERAVREVYGERALILRPGYVVGPDDTTDRFTYWPVRVARGGEMLAPDRPGAPMQLIDARDLAEFALKLIEEGASGAFNVTGPDYELTIGKVLETARQVSRSDARFHWATVEFLQQNNVELMGELPLWVPDRGETAGFASIDISKATARGLRFRPLEETIRDTLEWARTLPADHQWKAGMTEERERELLGALERD